MNKIKMLIKMLMNVRSYDDFTKSQIITTFIASVIGSNFTFLAMRDPRMTNVLLSSMTIIQSLYSGIIMTMTKPKNDDRVNLTKLSSLMNLQVVISIVIYIFFNDNMFVTFISFSILNMVLNTEINKHLMMLKTEYYNNDASLLQSANYDADSGSNIMCSIGSVVCLILSIMGLMEYPVVVVMLFALQDIVDNYYIRKIIKDIKRRREASYGDKNKEVA